MTELPAPGDHGGGMGTVDKSRTGKIKGEARQARLAAALRDNLKRRKRQAEGRSGKPAAKKDGK